MKDTEFNRIAKALADPQRFAILRRIATEEEVGCKCIVAEFDITPATISHHLKELSIAELVTIRKEGQCIHATLNHEVFEAYLAELRKRVLDPETAEA